MGKPQVDQQPRNRQHGEKADDPQADFAFLDITFLPEHLDQAAGVVIEVARLPAPSST